MGSQCQCHIDWVTQVFVFWCSYLNKPLWSQILTNSVTKLRLYYKHMHGMFLIYLEQVEKNFTSAESPNI